MLVILKNARNPATHQNLFFIIKEYKNLIQFEQFISI